jgi:hypothetical protein
MIETVKMSNKVTNGSGRTPKKGILKDSTKQNQNKFSKRHSPAN